MGQIVTEGISRSGHAAQLHRYRLWRRCQVRLERQPQSRLRNHGNRPVRPPNSIRIRLEFTKPFKTVNPTTFTFTPAGNGTQVTWTMTGENKGLGKIFALFMNMDKMVGVDFDKGLASLAAAAQRRS